MKLLAFAAALTITGCASVFDPVFKAEFDRGPNVKMTYRYVDTQDEMTIHCQQYREGKVLLGCAHVPPVATGECKVVLYRNGPADIKEHEEKHCRYGRWHG